MNLVVGQITNLGDFHKFCISLRFEGRNDEKCTEVTINIHFENTKIKSWKNKTRPLILHHCHKLSAHWPQYLKSFKSVKSSGELKDLKDLNRELTLLLEDSWRLQRFKRIERFKRIKDLNLLKPWGIKRFKRIKYLNRLNLLKLWGIKRFKRIKYLNLLNLLKLWGIKRFKRIKYLNLLNLLNLLILLNILSPQRTWDSGDLLGFKSFKSFKALEN